MANPNLFMTDPDKVRQQNNPLVVARPPMQTGNKALGNGLTQVSSGVVPPSTAAPTTVDVGRYTDSGFKGLPAGAKLVGGTGGAPAALPQRSGSLFGTPSSTVVTPVPKPVAAPAASPVIKSVTEAAPSTPAPVAAAPTPAEPPAAAPEAAAPPKPNGNMKLIGEIKGQTARTAPAANSWLNLLNNPNKNKAVESAPNKAVKSKPNSDLELELPAGIIPAEMQSAAVDYYNNNKSPPPRVLTAEEKPDAVKLQRVLSMGMKNSEFGAAQNTTPADVAKPSASKLIDNGTFRLPGATPESFASMAPAENASEVSRQVSQARLEDMAKDYESRGIKNMSDLAKSVNTVDYKKGTDTIQREADSAYYRKWMGMSPDARGGMDPAIANRLGRPELATPGAQVRIVGGNDVSVEEAISNNLAKLNALSNEPWSEKVALARGALREDLKALTGTAGVEQRANAAVDEGPDYGDLIGAKRFELERENARRQQLKDEQESNWKRLTDPNTDLGGLSPTQIDGLANSISMDMGISKTNAVDLLLKQISSAERGDADPAKYLEWLGNSARSLVPKEGGQ